MPCTSMFLEKTKFTQAGIQFSVSKEIKFTQAAIEFQNDTDKNKKKFQIDTAFLPMGQLSLLQCLEHCGADVSFC